MRTIILQGELGKRFGRMHRLDVRSPAEAIRALCANFRDFAGFLSSSHERNVGYRILSNQDAVNLDQLHDPAGQTIKIVPVIAGAGGGNPLASILIGGAIIAAAFFTGGVALVAGQGLVFSGLIGQVAFGIGVSLALGGISQLLAPTPPSPGVADATEPSFVFDGAVNTTSQGHPVPIGYGRLIVGSAVISAGLSADDIEA
jgi:predicted phage tail protein